jgi:hypothetical protein
LEVSLHHIDGKARESHADDKDESKYCSHCFSFWVSPVVTGSEEYRLNAPELRPHRGAVMVIR